MVDSPSDTRLARAILLLSVAAFASAASARLCDAMLPDIAFAFSVTQTEAAWTISAFAVAYGLLQVFYGPLGDRIGKYRLVGLTTAASTLGAAASVFSTSLDGLIVARLLTGATAAGIIPLSMAWIGDSVPYERRQATLAHFLGGQVLGVIGGQLTGGFLADALGWRWAFALLATIFLLVGGLVLREAKTNGVPHEAAPRTPMATQVRSVLSIAWARAILTIVFVEGGLVFGPLAMVPAYAHTRFGLSLTQAGLLAMFFGLGGLSYILFARQFVRRFGEIGLAVSGGVLLAAAWGLLAATDSAIATPLAISVATFLAGLGYYKLHNTLQINATQMAPATRGTAVSLFASAFFLGQSLGVYGASWCVHRLGYAVLFTTAAAAIPFLACLFAFLLHARKRQA